MTEVTLRDTVKSANKEVNERRNRVDKDRRRDMMNWGEGERVMINEEIRKELYKDGGIRRNRSSG